MIILACVALPDRAPRLDNDTAALGAGGFRQERIVGAFSRGLCTLVLRRRWPWRYAQRITFGPIGTVVFLVGAITARPM